MIYDTQRASMWKRLSAALFDGILLGVAAVLFAYLLSVALGFDTHYQALSDAYVRYGEEYGVSFNMGLADYEAMTEAEIGRLNEAYAALSQDEEAMYAYNMLVSLTLTIISIGILLAYLVMEFTIPMCLQNGQTIGKKIFGIGLMRNDGVKITGSGLFARTFLGKYAVGSMVPALIMLMIFFGMLGLTGTIILALIALVQIILLLATHNHTPIHDLLAASVCIDLGSQLIFDTYDDMIAYKKKVHAEQVANTAY